MAIKNLFGLEETFEEEVNKRFSDLKGLSIEDFANNTELEKFFGGKVCISDYSTIAEVIGFIVLWAYGIPADLLSTPIAAIDFDDKEGMSKIYDMFASYEGKMTEFCAKG